MCTKSLLVPPGLQLGGCNFSMGELRGPERSGVYPNTYGRQQFWSFKIGIKSPSACSPTKLKLVKLGNVLHRLTKNWNSRMCN